MNVVDSLYVYLVHNCSSKNSLTTDSSEQVSVTVMLQAFLFINITETDFKGIFMINGMLNFMEN